MEEEEKNLIEAKHWYFEKRIEETVSAINKNNMEGLYVKDKETALNEILKRIPRNATVSHGGSYTLHEIGIIKLLKKGKYYYLGKNSSPGQSVTDETRLKDFSVDIYLTSVNAITLKGELIAIDGFGNRAACLLFGPKKVLVVAGKNKIVNTLEDGIRRTKEYVAPIHAKRRNWNLPCAQVGKCVNCNDPKKICNKIGIIQYERDKDRITVILVGEDLGI